MEVRRIRRQGLFSAGGIYRAALLASTALPTLMAGSAAVAQTLAPDTTPQGGSVVAGAASIAQGNASKVITQTSQNAAINWQSFNVGSAAKVQFVQPSSTAIALNRVISASPSVIAGRISANGQLVLINQSGVVFTKGSEVNAEAVVVSTSDINTKDFMAGRMNFSGAPNPGAKIINDGQITARQAGLVGLVAPQVLNNGVITASLGTVQLAAGSAFVLDLYGDRLISINVTQAVRAVDVGGKTLPALITNRGLIVANGGKIVLTARDADALVTQLIDAGGTIQANTTGGHAGSISLQGVGGNISIAGNLLAQGKAAGAKGGAIEAITDGAVTAKPGAVIDASGAAGGGVVALGTDVARAEQGAADVSAPRAASVTVAAGAVLKADATGRGNAGTVTLLSSQNTDFTGSISVQGGPQGGNGGLAEISSGGVISLSGTVFDTAISGQAGEVLLDPATLVVSTGTMNTGSIVNGETTTFGDTTSTTTSYIDAGSLGALGGTVVLEAGTLISIVAPVSSSTIGELVIDSLKDVSIEAAISLTGSLEVDAGGTLDVGAALNASNISLLDPGIGNAIGINASIGTDNLALAADTVTQGGAGVLNVTALTGSITGAGPVGLAGTIGTLGLFSLSSGDLSLDDAEALIIGGSVTVPGLLTLTDSAGGVTEATGGAIDAGTLTTGTAGIDGTAELNGANTIGTLADFSVGTNSLDLLVSGSLNTLGTVTAATATLAAPTLNLGGTLAVTDLVALAADTLTGTLAGGFPTLDVAPLTASDIDLGGTSLLSALDLSGDFFNSLASLALLEIGTAGTYAANNILSESVVSFSAASVELDATQGVSLAAGATLTATELTLSGSSFGLDGTLNAPLLSLDATGVVTEAGSAVVNATLVSGSAGGAVSLAGSLNTIGALGNFSASSDLTLNDTEALTIDGAVTAPGLFTLTDSGGGVTESSAGTILGGGILTTGTGSIAGSVDFGGSLNAIAELDGFDLSSGDLALNDSQALTVGGSVTVPGAFTLTDSAGGVTEASGGVIDAGTLSTGTASIDGTTELGGANTIGTLGSFDLGAGDLALNDAEALTIAGPVTVPGLFTLTDIAGGVTEASGGVIDAGTLTTGTANIAGTTELSGANTIGALGSFDLSAGDLALNDAEALTIAGSVTVPGVFTLTDSAGGVTEVTGGIIDAGTLTTGTASIDGSTELSGANTIGTLADFDVATNSFDLTDSGSLNTLGTLTAATATLGAPTLNLGGTLAVTDLVALAADALTGTLVGGFPTLDVAPLTAMAIDLGGSSLADALDISGGFFGSLASLAFLEIGKAGSFTANSILSENNVSLGAANVLLDSAGGISLAAGATLSSPQLMLSGSSFGLDGTLNASVLSLTASGAVTELDAGVVNATLVSGSIGGGASLAGTLNTIGTLAAFSSGGDLILDDAEALTISGPVTVPGAFTLTDSTGGVTEAAGGVVDAGTLTTGTASIDGTTELAGANTIGTLGSFDLSVGDLALNDSQALSIDGVVMVPGAFTLTDSAGGVTEAAGGVIDAGTLSTGMGSVDGAVELTGANTIGTLADFDVGTNSFDLIDSGFLGTQGTLTAATATLAAPTLNLGGTLAVTDLVALAADALTGTLAGSFPTLDVAPLTATGIDLGGSSLADALDISGAFFGSLASLAFLEIGKAGSFAANSILSENIVSLNANTVLLDPTQGISLAGGATLTATQLTLNGTSFGLDGSLNASVLSLAASGVVTEAGDGVVNATLVSGSIGGAGSLAGTLNTIGTLGAFSTGSDLTLDDAEALTIAGPVTVPGLFTLTDSAGGVTEATGGVIDSGTLTTGTASIAGTTELSGANTIGTLGSFDLSTGDLALNDSQALSIDGLVTVPGAFTLTDSAGGVTEASGGVIDAGTLSTGTASIAGITELSGANTIGALGSFDLTTGDLALNDAEALTIAGPVTVPGAFTLTDSAGGVTEATGGVIDAGTLTTGTASIAGTTELSGANTIGTLGSFDLSAGDLALNDAEALTIAGPVTVPGLFTLTDSAGGVTEAAGGVIDAGTLTTGTASIDGTTELGGANTIGTLGSFDLVAGDLALNDAEALTIAGPVTVPGLFTLTDSAGGVTEASGGVIDAGTLSTGTASIAGTTELSGANTIGTLGSFDLSAGDLALNDAESLTIAGPVTVPGLFTLTDTASGVTEAAGGVIDAGTLSTGTASIAGTTELSGANTIGMLGSFDLSTGDLALNDAEALTIAGPVTVPGVFTLTDTAGGVTEATGGVIDASTLSTGTASIAGTTELSGANTIGTLGSFDLSTGDLALNDAEALTIAGPVTVPGLFTLTDSAGGVTEAAGGVIDAGTLSTGTASIAGTTELSGANMVGTLGSFDLSAGDLALNDAEALTIAGPVTLPGLFALTDSAGGVTEAAGGLIDSGTLTTGTASIAGTTELSGANMIGTLGSFDLSVGDLALNDSQALSIDGLVTVPGLFTLTDSAGGVTEAAGGVIDAATLSTGTASIAGTTELSGANMIGTLGSFDLSIGDLALNDSQALSIDGLMTVPGAFTLTDSAGGVTEAAGGVIDAGTLSTGTASIAGPTELSGANTIGTLGSFDLSIGDLALNDSQALSIDGLVTVPGLFTLTDSAGGVTEAAGGVIDAGTLSTGTASIAGTTELSGANTIGTLGSFDLSAGDLALNDAEALTIAGPVTVPGLFTVTDSAGGVTEATGGMIDAGTLTTGTASVAGTTELSGANTIGTLGSFDLSAGDLALNDAEALTIAGSVTVPGLFTLTDSAGGVTEAAGGVIDAGTLSTGTASIAGTAELSGANTIGTLGSFDLSAGDLALNDAESLTIAGPVTVPGLFTLTDTAGGVTEAAGGVIDAGTLSTGTASIDGTTELGDANTIGTLGSFDLSSGDLALNDSQALTIDGAVTMPGLFTLTDTAGGVTEVTGGVIDVGTLSTGTASIAGSTELSGANTIGTLGGFDLSIGDLALNDSQALTIDGAVTVPGLFTLTDTAGGVTEVTGGVIDAGTLSTGTASIAGSTELSGANTIGTLGGFDLSIGDLALNDAEALTIAGPVTVPGLFTLTDSAGGVTEATGGLIDAGTLSTGTASIAGSTELSGANTIGTLGSFDLSGGDLALNDAEALTIAGPVTVPGLFALTDSAGGVTEAVGGVIDAGTLSTGTASIDGTTELSGANTIGTLGSFDLSAGDLALNDAEALTIAGPVTVPGLFTLTDSAGGVTEATGGVIDAGTLTTGTASIDGTTKLIGANTIGTLGGFDLSAGDLALNDSQALSIDGAVTVPGAFTLTDSNSGGVAEAAGGAISAGTLTTGAGRIVNLADLNGSLNSIGTLGNFTVTGAGAVLLLNDTAPLTIDGAVDVPGNVALTDSGTVLEQGGQITTGSLSTGAGGIGGDALLSGGNRIGTLDNFSVAGSVLSFNNDISLSLAGLLNVGGGNGTIVLADDDTVQEVGTGSVDAGTLTTGGSLLSGDALLTTATNAIISLTAFSATGNIALEDHVALLTAAGISAGSSVDINNDTGLDAEGINGGSIVLGAGTDLTAGTINAGGTALLTALDITANNVHAGTTAQLLAGNSISANGVYSTIAEFGAGGDITANGVQGTTSVALSAGDDITAGNISGGAVTLDADGNLNASDVDAGGVAVLTAQLQDITANDIRAGTTAELSAGVDITANGVDGTEAVELSAGNDITANDITGGVVGINAGHDLNIGALNAFGNALLTAGNDLTAGGVFAGAAQLNAGSAIDASNIYGSGSIQFDAGGAIQLDQEISTSGFINIASATDVTQLAGAANAGDIIIAPLLMGNISGNINLPNANNIGSIGNLDAGGSAVIAGISQLSGPLSAASATLISIGNFALNGDISTGGALEIDAAGGVTQPGASNVLAAAVRITSGLVALSPADMIVINPAPAPVSQGSPVPGDTITLAGNITTGNIALVAPSGSIAQTGGLNANTLSGIAVASAAFTGADNIQTIGDFAVQNGTQNGVFTLNETGNVTILGPLMSDVVDITSGGIINFADGGSLDIAGKTISSLVLTGSSSPPKLTQNGNFDIGIAYEPNPPANLALGTLEISGAGSLSNVMINFVPFQNGAILQAPNIDLILNPGAQGSATGNIVVRGLTVLSGKFVHLTGSVNGFGGLLAASQGKALPIPNPQYQFNSCPIGSSNCQILPTIAVPQGNPLDDFDITSRRRRRLNKHVNLPGVAARDF